MTPPLLRCEGMPPRNQPVESWEQSTPGRGLPAHVEGDLRRYLDCGILGRAFARIRCPDCGFERLGAFSGKARSCPSCNARRMEDASDHLVHDVFPSAPVRQWVLSFPHRIRFLAARDPVFCSRRSWRR